MQQQCDFQDPSVGFTEFLKLLLDRVLFGLEGEDGSVVFSYRVKVPTSLLRIDVDQLGEHKIGQNLDFMIISKTGDDAVKEIGGADA